MCNGIEEIVLAMCGKKILSLVFYRESQALGLCWAHPADRNDVLSESIITNCIIKHLNRLCQRTLETTIICKDCRKYQITGDHCHLRIRTRSEARE